MIQVASTHVFSRLSLFGRQAFAQRERKSQSLTVISAWRATMTARNGPISTSFEPRSDGGLVVAGEYQT